MATNTTVLIVVAALAALVFAGALAGVTYKTRTPKRGAMIRDQVAEDALRLRRQQTIADEFDARAHAAQVEIDIKTVRARSLQQQATAYRSEAFTSRDQLNEIRGSAMRGSADTLTAAAQPPTVPRLAG
jgi:hypothetical protein